MKKILVIIAAVIGLATTPAFACGGMSGGQQHTHQSNTENGHQPSADEGNGDHKEHTMNMSDQQGHSETDQHQMHQSDAENTQQPAADEKK